MTEEIKQFLSESVEKWRQWLEKNHLKEKRVLLVRYKKHSGKKTFSYREAMDTAICFGWIDSTAKRVDDEKFGITFVRRNEKTSRWSNNTLSYAKRLMEEGKMSENGLKMYGLGLKKKTIDHGLSKNPEVPKELEKELNKSKKARMFFDGLAPSYRRVYIYAVLRAKRAETKEKWAKIVAKKCKEGKKNWYV